MDMLLQISMPVNVEGALTQRDALHYSVITFDDAFVSVWRNAWPELRSRRIPWTVFVPTGSLGIPPQWLDHNHADAQEVVASAEMLRSLATDERVTIGSHSVTHPNFSQLDDTQARFEFEQSKSDLEAIIEKKVDSFSFPHGAYNPHLIELARKLGYRRVYTIEPELIRHPRDPFVLGRIRVDFADWPVEFRLKAQGAYRWLACASAWKRRLLSPKPKGWVAPGDGAWRESSKSKDTSPVSPTQVSKSPLARPSAQA